MGEIKSGAYTSYNAQLRDMLRYAADTQSEFTLYIKDGARVLQPLRDAINALPGGSIVPYAAGVGATVLDAPLLFVNPALLSPYANHGEGKQL